MVSRREGDYLETFFLSFFFLAVLTMARPRGSACITAKGYSRVETRDKSRSTPVTWHGKDRQRLLPRRNENKVHSEIRNILSLPLKDAHPCRHRRVRNPTFFLCCPERECVCLANVILASTSQKPILTQLEPSHEVSAHHGAVRAEVGDVHDGVDQKSMIAKGLLP